MMQLLIVVIVWTFNDNLILIIMIMIFSRNTYFMINDFKFQTIASFSLYHSTSSPPFPHLCTSSLLHSFLHFQHSIFSNHWFYNLIHDFVGSAMDILPDLSWNVCNSKASCIQNGWMWWEIMPPYSPKIGVLITH